MTLLTRRRASGGRPAAGTTPAAQLQATPARGGNHRQIAQPDRAEQEAERAASAVMSGRSAPADALSPRPAAAYAVPGARRTPLPDALRQRLELAFGADLRAVRVLQDGAAAQAAAAEGARAFTAGADLVFAAGRFRPDTAAGQELIAHEVAHALQQTGRRGADGRLQATRATGSRLGRIQRQDGPPAGTPGVSTETDWWPQIRAAHLAANGRAAAFRRFVGVIGTALGESVPEGRATAAGTALSERIVGGEFRRYQPRSQGLLYDCMKFMGLFRAAHVLLEASPSLPTIGNFGAFSRDVTANREQDWIAPLLRADGPSTAVAGAMRAHMAHLRAALRHAGTSRDPTPEVVDAAEAAESAGTDHNRLGPNERERLALATLLGVDRITFTRLAQLWSEVPEQRRRAVAAGRQPATDFQVLRAIAEDMRDNLTASLPGLAGSALAAHRVLVESLVRETTAAAAFWDRAEAASAATSARLEVSFDLDALAVAAPAALHLPDIPPVSTLRTALAGNAADLFRLAEPAAAGIPVDAHAVLAGRLPDHATFLGAARAMAATYRTAARGVMAEIGVRARVPAAHQAGTPEADELDALAWLAVYAEQHATRLDTHPHADPDYMLEYRYRTAAHLADMAHQLGWRELVTAGLAVLRAEDSSHSYLILRGTWEEDSDAPTAAMAYDLGRSLNQQRVENGRLVSHRLAIGPAEIVTFFQAEFLTRLTSELNNQIRLHAASPSLATTPTLATRVEAARAFPRPQRWKVEDFRFVMRQSDPRNASFLILNHPETDSTFASEPAWQASSGVFSPQGDTNRVVAWVLPDLAPMIAVLRTIPAVRTAIADWTDQPSDPMEWLVALRGRAGDPAALRRAVGTFLDQREQTQREGLPPLLRQTTIIERRLAGERIRGWFDAFADNHLQLGLLNDIEELIRGFTGFVQPIADLEMQFTALLLSVGESMRDAFRYERAFDTITGFYDYVAMALTHSRGNGLQRLADEGFLGPGETLASMEAGRTALEAVLAHFDDVRASVQERFGLEVEGDTLRSLLGGSTMQAGEANGFITALWTTPRNADAPDIPPLTRAIYYQIDQIHRNFRFHPAYGSAGISGYRAAILQTMDGEDIAPDTPLLTVTYAVTEGSGEERTYGNDRTVVITASDVAWLEAMAAVVDNAARARQLEALGEAMQEGTDLALDLIELIPGVGQGVALARLTANVIRMIASELPEIRRRLVEEPQETIRIIVETLQGRLLDPDNLWRFLLGEVDLSPFSRFRRDARAEGRNDRMSRAGPGGRRLTRLIMATRRIGSRLARSFDRVHSRMRGPISAARSDILARPRVARVLRNLPDLLIRAESAIEGLDERRRQIQGLVEDAEGLSTAMGNLVEGLQSFELPDEVVPMDLVIEVVLGFILDRAAGRKGRIARRVLEATGALPMVSGKIAEALAGGPADLNTYWRGQVRQPLQDRVAEARDGMVVELYAMLNRLGSGIASFQPPELPAIEVETDPFPEIEAHMAEPTPGHDRATPERAIPAEPPNPAGGTALPTGMRQAAEQRFGHDFRHVRLHRDTAADRSTRGLGADALASGSHVYLRRDLDPARGSGARILDHELAHVLQQTGPRPLGGRHGTAPRAGRPGLGLRHDRRREAAADRMARAAAANAAGGPLAVEAAGGDGLLPSARAAAMLVAESMSSTRFARDYAGQIDRAAATITTPAAANSTVRRILDGVNADIAGDSPATWPAFLSSPEGKRALRAYLTAGTQATAIRHALPALEQRAQAPVRARAGTAPGSAPATELRPRRFANLLEGYIYSRTGVALAITLTGRGDATRVARTVIRNVQLGRVSTRTDLWRAVKRTTGVFTPRQWRQIHARFAAEFPRPHPWSSHPLKLGDSFVSDMQADFAAAAPSFFLPNWHEYTNPTSREPMVGLRVGTHGELRGLRNSTTDRESHHLPQFLLVEYFRNMNDTKVTGQENFDLPGFEPAGSGPYDRFSAPGGTLQLSSLDTGSERGAGMAAVLLAARTHKKGSLHLNRESAWDEQLETQSTTRQGATIHNFFHDTLRARLRNSVGTGYGDLANADAMHSLLGDPARRNAVRTDIHAAMKRTYDWIYRERMLEPLERALEDIEIPYYAERAAMEVSGDDDPLPADKDPSQAPQRIDGVVRAVRDKNADIMRPWT